MVDVRAHAGRDVRLGGRVLAGAGWFGKMPNGVALDLAFNEAAGNVEFLGAFPAVNAVLISAQTERGKNQPQGERAETGQRRHHDGGAKEGGQGKGRNAGCGEKRAGIQRWLKGEVPM